jgi:hypothetical protein
MNDNFKPAIKLLEFFRTIAAADRAISSTGRIDVESGGLSRFATAKAEGASLTMRELPPISAQDAERWVRYWNSVGLFD